MKLQVTSSRFKVQGSRFGFLVLPFTLYFLLFFACSIPNLESAQCAEARNQIKHFYSYHFGSEMQPSAENLKLREEYVTEQLKRQLEKQTESKTDYFTQTDDYPKAFRVGACRAASPEKTVFEVLLFWKDETRSEQREISVEMVKQDKKWLVSKVENKR